MVTDLLKTPAAGHRRTLVNLHILIFCGRAYVRVFAALEMSETLSQISYLPCFAPRQVARSSHLEEFGHISELYVKLQLVLVV